MAESVLRCEACGKKKTVDSSTMSRWMNEKQFFCNDCKEELGIDDDDPYTA